MDHIFDSGYINQVCSDIKSALNESKGYIAQMHTLANQAEQAVNDVPADARENSVYSAVSSVKSALNDIDIDKVITKLDDCKDRATALIPTADSQAAAEISDLISTINQVKEMLASMRQFLVNTPLNSPDFSGSFSTAKTQWNRVLNDANKALDVILANVKGAEKVSMAFSKDPVNLSTGNFIYEKTDLELGGDSVFRFHRFYNAINQRKGRLGYDWNHNYEVRILKEEEEYILLLEEGKEERFVLGEDGKLRSLLHSNGKLIKTDTGYVYTKQDQSAYTFNEEGYFLKKESLSGEVITLTYEEPAGEEKGEGQDKPLTKVSRNTGEFFTLTYDEKGCLKTVTDHTGRQVIYEIREDYLLGVTTPGGHRYSYEYGITGKLEQVINARDIPVVENVYDEKNRTIRQNFPDGGSMSYNYDDENKRVTLTERNGSQVTYIHDDKFRDIKHIYSNGEERFEYNKTNQKTLVVDKLGRKTQYAYDGNGNLTRVINALGEKVEICYDEKNLPTSLRVNGEEKFCNHYNENGDITESRDALGNCSAFTYKSQGRPKEIIQPDGSKLTLAYDERGNIQEIKDVVGSVTRYEYDALNRVTKTMDALGQETAYAYDVEDNLIQVTNPAGKTRSYEYNASNKVTVITDFDGSTITREYNALNKPSKVIDQEGRETLLSYDPMWNLARVTEPNGAKTTFLYNEHNLLGRIRNANGDVTRFTYDPVGNRTAVTDEEGNQTRFTYDELNRLTEVTDPEGNTTVYSYDGEGNIVKVTDALGNTLKLAYDANGNLVREEDSEGAVRAYTYTTLNDIETITDEGGRVIKYTYEPGGRVRSITYPEGTSESYTYNELGNVATYTNQRGYTRAYYYDSLDQITGIRGAEGEEQNYTYDAVGNVTSFSDEEGNLTRYEYTLSGQLKKVTDALGNETCYTYDVCDRLIEIKQYEGKAEEGKVATKAEGKGAHVSLELQETLAQNQKNQKLVVTRYDRDLQGNVTGITDAHGLKEHYTYDKKGQLLSKLDKEGYLTKYQYSSAGDITNVFYADGREVKLSYNALRQLEEMEDWLGITRIDNDSKGRAKKVTYPKGEEVSYTYGLAGERTGITYPDGREVKYEYDEALRLKRLLAKEQDNITQDISYHYDQKGNLKEKTSVRGINSQYDYNPKGQLVSLSHKKGEKLLESYTYRYNALGFKTEIHKEGADRGSQNGLYQYDYDPMGRLTEVKKEGSLLRTYGYDAYGNRIRSSRDGKETSYAYNALNQLVSQVDTEKKEQNEINPIKTNYTYDKRGNLTEIRKNGNVSRQYFFGALNRLEKARNLETGKGALYQYNGMGHRIGRQEGKPTEPSLPTEQLATLTIDPVRQVEDILDLTKGYHNLLARTEDGNTTAYTWDYQVTGMSSKEGSFDYLQDEMGSPIRLLDSECATRGLYGYEEFGAEIDELAIQGNIVQPFTYTGYQKDAITGTYYAQAREYRPEAGRFISEDIVRGFAEHPFTQNHYVYCWNQPLDLVDFDGAWPSWNDIKEGINNLGQKVKEFVADNIYGTDVTVYKTDILGNPYTVTVHQGGNIFVNSYTGYVDEEGDIIKDSYTGWSLNSSVSVGDWSVKSTLSGGSDLFDIKVASSLKHTDKETGISTQAGLALDKNGLSLVNRIGGTSGNIPIPLNNGEKIDSGLSVSWSLNMDKEIMNGKQLLECALVIGAIVLIAVIILDDGTIIGIADDGFLVPLAGYVLEKLSTLAPEIINMFQAMPACI